MVAAKGSASSKVNRSRASKRSRADFGKKIRALRQQKNLGLREFARLVKLSPSYLSELENGKTVPPGESKIVVIADAFDEDSDFLLSLAGRIASDVQLIVRKHPAEFAKMIRRFKELSASNLRTITLNYDVLIEGESDRVMVEDEMDRRGVKRGSKNR